jgi:5'(3')-deoxyribonucleotidase
MDGVVADFDALARAVVKNNNFDTLAERWPDDSWEQIKKYPHFYRAIPKMLQADAMMSLAERFRDELGWNLYMLTAIPRLNDIPDCFWDKIGWMREYYPNVIVRFGPYSEDKQHHCRPGDILVDDRTSNCGQWRSSGGHAVQVLPGQYDLALAELEDLFKMERLRLKEKF